MSKCGTCAKALPTDGDFATCGICKRGYHFSPCSTVSDSSWRSMGPERKAAWKCPGCREPSPAAKPATSKSGDQGTPKSNSLSGGENSSKEDKILCQLGALTKQFAGLEASLKKKFDDKIGELEKSLTFYGNQIDEMTQTIKRLEQKHVLFEKRLKTQEEENKELKCKVRQLEIIVHQSEQRNHSTKLEISGFKEVDVDENLFVQKLLERTGYTSGNIQFRVDKIVKPPKDNQAGNNSLVVQFRNEEVRNDVLTKVKEGKLYSKMGDVMHSNSTLPLFFNEYLTPYYKKLFYEAKKLKMDKNYAYLWVKHGKILLKKKKESKIETLASMDDLGKM